MTAVLLACLAAAFFGGLAVATREGLRLGGDPVAGALVTAFVGCAVSAGAVAIFGATDYRLELGELWPFLAMGAVVPGISQIIFTTAVRASGPSRPSVVVGMTPVLSALFAIVFLGERPKAVLGIATALIVLGGVSLAWERERPVHFRMLGILLAFACALFFAVRDNVLRWATGDTEVPPLVAATASLLTATTAVALVLLVERRSDLGPRVRRAALAFLPAGILLGLAYDALTSAFAHGRVTVVAPLNATFTLWAVGLSALIVGQSELIGRRLVLAALLIVAGGALIGATR